MYRYIRPQCTLLLTEECKEIMMENDVLVSIQEEKDMKPSEKGPMDRIETQVYSPDPADWNISLYVKVTHMYAMYRTRVMCKLCDC